MVGAVATSTGSLFLSTMAMGGDEDLLLCLCDVFGALIGSFVG